MVETAVAPLHRSPRRRAHPCSLLCAYACLCAYRTPQAARMTLAQALQTIRKHWRVLPHASKDSHEAVWIRIPPEDAAEVYEEWVGMRGDGSLVWAYTSGYGYRNGTQSTEHLQEVTVLQ